MTTGGAGRPLVVLALATALAMGVWFSTSAVVPQLVAAWDLRPGGAALLTVAVQLGFVVGALMSAGTGLADAVPARRLVAVGALGAAAANAALLLADGLGTALASRAVTGVLLALVYPSALKEVATWSRRRRGTAMGAMVGALTLGTALPHVVAGVAALGGTSAGGAAAVPWQAVVVGTSVLAGVGGVLALTLRRSGPHARPPTAVDRRAALAALRRRPVVLAVVAYAGHMWELYAMWAWVGALVGALGVVGSGGAGTAWLTAAAVAAGAPGCLLVGALGDRVGRPRAVLVCVAGSVSAALALAALREGPAWLLVVLLLGWGFWVVADSAQLSALVTERADPDLVGGAVAVQMAVGYLTTAVTVWLVPVVVDAVSWSAALVVLAAGSTVGGLAVLALRRDDAPALRPAGRPTS